MILQISFSKNLIVCHHGLVTFYATKVYVPIGYVPIGYASEYSLEYKEYDASHSLWEVIDDVTEYIVNFFDR